MRFLPRNPSAGGTDDVAVANSSLVDARDSPASLAYFRWNCIWSPVTPLRSYEKKIVAPDAGPAGYAAQKTRESKLFGRSPRL
ncbi:MAG TPA: hypothetical protein VGR97_04450 [Candidatus Acidoferrales bacterium]|nr:hypothetical protein [Candidatus Acidoferrales bacterium]